MEVSQSTISYSPLSCEFVDLVEKNVYIDQNAQHRPATQCEEQGDGREGIADCWRSQGDVESSWGDSEESDSDPVLENGEEEDEIGGVHGEGRAPVKENTQNKMKNKKKATAGIAAGMGIVSDAQLSCPLCFTTVCLECQRHARYHTQV